ncbi:PREDICTED: uncharacterized protein LOC109171094 [Ipomoea nil]|uniref:uncharacterized protein LOC109171094 n=1 Tax=Ipomoea nil TaxID=35883 RepID=UPI000901E143|nr:PREDICTED: uncharacterized protein LOC109171094 [Ipomoea nil]
MDPDGLYEYNCVEKDLLRLRNKVEKLLDDNGIQVEGAEAIGGVITNYFTKLFTAETGDVEEVISCINSHILPSDNARLVRPVSADEVRHALFQMHSDKSSGPDGFGPGFFQHYWNIFGSDITLFCRRFFESKKLPARANDTFVMLVPKKVAPESMKDLRPIALCNVLYKIVSKMCANRMKTLLDGIISLAQSAFVLGRLITDNIMLGYEAHHYLKRKTQGRDGVAALKIDMSKAYNRDWVDIIYETISSVNYHVLHEQRKLGPIKLRRGLQQGDPLSPYLFLLVAEGLSALIDNRMRRGLLHGITIARGAPSISHLLFADDCFLFLQSIRGEVVNILGVSQGDTSGRYLGLPSLVSGNKKAILGFLKDKILSRVRSWNSRCLSRAGREVLLKNVLQAMPCYSMMVFLLPKGLFNEIEVLLNMYFWTENANNAKGLRWKTWKCLRLPKDKGGMDFRQLHEMNLTLLGKQPRCSLFDATAGSNPSFVWQGLLKAVETIHRGSRRCIGDDQTTTIGFDPWLPSSDNPFVTSPLHDSIMATPVSFLLDIHGARWDVDCVRDIFNTRDASLIMNIPVSLRKPPDAWVWGGGLKGEYSVKSCYRLLVGEAQEAWSWSVIWNLQGSRNEKIWDGVPFVRDVAVVRALCFVSNWREANVTPKQSHATSEGATRWKPPSTGRIKLNTDTGMDLQNNRMGLGWILRDDGGVFLAVKCITVAGSFDVKVAKAMCVCEALSWLKGTGLGDVDVETDSQLVFNSLKSFSFTFAFGYVVDDIKEVVSEIHGVNFCFVKRSANRAAHLVAREAVSVSGCGEWFDNPPHYLVDCLLSDLMN